MKAILKKSIAIASGTLLFSSIAFAGFSVSTAKIVDTTLTIAGQANDVNKTITVNGVAMGTSNSSKNFSISKTPYTAPSDCYVTVSDGKSSLKSLLSGCGTSTPSPTPTPAPEPAPTGATVGSIDVDKFIPATYLGAVPGAGQIIISNGALSGETIRVGVFIGPACGLSAGCVVSLTSSNPQAAPAPATILVPKGFSAGSVTFKAGTVSSVTAVTFTATYGTSKSAPFLISNSTIPPVPYSFWSESAPRVTGQLVTYKLTMDSACQTAAGCPVSLNSSNPQAAPVPTSVVVPNGQTSALVSFVAGLVSTKTFYTLTANSYGFSVTTRASYDYILPPWPKLADGSIQMEATGFPIKNSASAAPKALVALYADIYENLDVQCQSAFPGNGQMVPTGSQVQVVKVLYPDEPTTNYIYYTQKWVCKNGPYTGWPQSVVLARVGTGTNPTQLKATVCLTKPAPTGGVVAKLSSSYLSMSVPPSVTIPAGAVCATANMTSSSTFEAQVTATIGGMAMGNAISW